MSFFIYMVEMMSVTPRYLGCEGGVALAEGCKSEIKNKEVFNFDLKFLTIF